MNTRSVAKQRRTRGAAPPDGDSQPLGEEMLDGAAKIVRIWTTGLYFTLQTKEPFRRLDIHDWVLLITGLPLRRRSWTKACATSPSIAVPAQWTHL